MIQVKHFKGGLYDVITYNNEFVYYGDTERGLFWKRRIAQFLGKHDSGVFRLQLESVPPFANPKRELFPLMVDAYIDVTDYDYSLHTPRVIADELNIELMAALVEFVEESDDEQ